MNTLFGDMAANLATFNPELEAVNAARPHAEEIIRLNFEDQLHKKGIDSEGKSLGNYAGGTVWKKNLYSSAGGRWPRGKFPASRFERDDSGKNFRDTQTNHIGLKDTGFFQRSGRVKFEERKFSITADDMKITDDGASQVRLTDIYGDEILGLTEENIDFVSQKFILPTLQQTLRHKLFANKNTF